MPHHGAGLVGHALACPSKIMHKPKKVALAYSGGLDTSVIIPWLKENYGCEVVAVCGDIGQGVDELTGLEAKARNSGAAEVYIEDMREEFVSQYLWKLVRSGGVYEHKYLLGTSIARPLLAKKQVQVALASGCDALSHGCTGKGNDQVRFELTYKALAPHLPVIAPWREWGIVSREDPIEYACAHHIPIAASTTKIYSRDRNIWHISHEGGALEDPANAAPDEIWMLTRSPAQAPGAAGGRLPPATCPADLSICFAGRHNIHLSRPGLCQRHAQLGRQEQRPAAWFRIGTRGSRQTLLPHRRIRVDHLERYGGPGRQPVRPETFRRPGRRKRRCRRAWQRLHRRRPGLCLRPRRQTDRHHRGPRASAAIGFRRKRRTDPVHSGAHLALCRPHAHPRPLSRMRCPWCPGTDLVESRGPIRQISSVSPGSQRVENRSWPARRDPHPTSGKYPLCRR